MSATDFVARVGPALFDAFAHADAAPSLDVSFLKHSAHSVVFRAEMDGGDVVVKVFGEGEKASDRYQRELGAMEAARASGLVPRLRGHEPRTRAVIRDFVPGRPLNESVTSRTLAATCTRLGRWYGAFSRIRRVDGTSGNWGEYLDGVAALDGCGAISDVSLFLRDFDFPCVSLAKNDAALSNFILSPDRGLLGIDFECARFKPLGWDILLTARALSRNWPGRTDEVCDILCREFCRSGIGHFDRFRVLTKSFVIGSLFEKTFISEAPNARDAHDQH
ncbi:MAG: hypothetical protein CMH11_17730 [Maritimibacter sp.]|nr:hypothetical protein [Maritimibacter sp.]|tara:strand:+ start:21585 stop:22415 length:831 start_codon:yes stop_codon:yes gene_type:complete